MTWKDFHAQTWTTAIYPTSDKLPGAYAFLGFQDEINEFMDVALLHDPTDTKSNLTKNLKKEAGDVFWCYSRLCHDLDFKVSELIEKYDTITGPVDTNEFHMLDETQIWGHMKKYWRDDKQNKDILESVIHKIMENFLFSVLNFNLKISDVLDMNVQKLQSRKDRNVLKGSGDDR